MSITGQRAREIREALSLSPLQMAIRLWITEDALRRWERGDVSIGGPAQLLYHMLETRLIKSRKIKKRQGALPERYREILHFFVSRH